MKCTFCNQEATNYDAVIIQPPVCVVHEDMLILIETMDEKGEVLTLESVEARLNQAMANGGGWTLTPGDVPRLLPEFLKKREEIGQKEALNAATTA